MCWTGAAQVALPTCVLARSLGPIAAYAYAVTVAPSDDADAPAIAAALSGSAAETQIALHFLSGSRGSYLLLEVILVPLVPLEVGKALVCSACEAA